MDVKLGLAKTFNKMQRNMMKKNKKRFTQRASGGKKTQIIVSQARAKRNASLGPIADHYALANAFPFHPMASGAKVPDEVTFPSVAFPVLSSDSFNSDANGWFARFYTPWINAYNFGNTSISAGGTVTWSSTQNQVSDAANLALYFSLYRTVGWGIRITLEEALATTTGHIWIGLVPIDVTTATTGIDRIPTTEAQMQIIPYRIKVPLSALTTPMVISARAFDRGIERYRTLASPQAAGNQVENAYGWCGIVVYGGGLQASTSIVNIEYVNHVEAIYKATSGLNVGATPSASDASGYQKARRATESLPVGRFETREEMQDERSLLNKLYEASGKVSRVVGNLASATVTASVLANNLTRGSISGGQRIRY